jgi:hypothetical protein
MNTNPHDHLHDLKASESVSSPAEETLRLIASLPAPDGLENRVNTALSSARQHGRVLGRGSLLAWHRTLGLTFGPESNWMRTAVAAAIVVVVAGGSWGVYSRVESSRPEPTPFAHNQPAKVIVLPPRMPVAGGFSGAGAMRTPVTLPGPAAPEHANADKPAKTNPARTKTAKKAATRPKAASTASQPDAPK